MKVLIATGGTGGHIFTAFAIAEELSSKGVDILLVGSRSGLEKQLMVGTYRLKFTSQRPLLGKGLKAKLIFPFFMILGLIQSLKIISEERPDGVVGTGGFGSFGCVFIASLMGLPTLINELDSVPGLTTKVLSIFAYEISAAFPSVKKDLPGRKVRINGFPVRKEITRCNKSIVDYGLDAAKRTILIFGGSRGARGINKLIPGLAETLKGEVQFIWQTGDSKITNEYKGKAGMYVTDFISDMGSAYGNSDLVISRSGALTVGELMATGLPAILIPYPYATKQHQMVNARWLEKQGLTRVISERDITVELLAYEIREQLKASENVKREPAVNGAELIADRMLSIIGG